jgi:hypothetical protein
LARRPSRRQAEKIPLGTAGRSRSAFEVGPRDVAGGALRRHSTGSSGPKATINADRRLARVAPRPARTTKWHVKLFRGGQDPSATPARTWPGHVRGVGSRSCRPKGRVREVLLQARTGGAEAKD